VTDYLDLIKTREGTKRDQNGKLFVYPDSRGNPTVGWGHLVVKSDNLKFNDIVDDARADALLRQDSSAALSAAQAQARRAGITDSDFIAHLGAVNFQLGTAWNSQFKDAWHAIMAGNYNEAAEDVGNSAWNQQTPIRVQDFQQALRTLAAKTPIAAQPAMDWVSALSTAKDQARQAGIKDDDAIAALASIIAIVGKDWNTSSPELRQAWQSIKDKKYQDAEKSIGKSSWAKQSSAKGKDFQQALIAAGQQKAAEDELGKLRWPSGHAPASLRDAQNAVRNMPAKSN